MNFSVNQFRHLYVANAKNTVNASASAGTIDVNNDTAKTHVYFQYKGVGGIMRSDLITTKNIISAKATDAAKMATSLKSFKLTLDSSVNSGNPVAGQHYVVSIKYTQFVGMSDEDMYFEYGDVMATSGMTPSIFYKKMAISLAKNTSVQGLVCIKLTTSTTSVDVTSLTKETDLTGTYTGILINELEQDWILGTKAQTFVNFEITGKPITVSGNNETIWASVTAQSAAGTVNNGKKIADLEYFCMGERGDIYRNVGYPNVIPTKYLVNPASAYYTFDIHYFYAGNNENVQKSERTLTIVSADKTVLNSIVTAFNTATGLSVATIA